MQQGLRSDSVVLGQVIAITVNIFLAMSKMAETATQVLEKAGTVAVIQISNGKLFRIFGSFGTVCFH